jgi:hypothetical protein
LFAILGPKPVRMGLAAKMMDITECLEYLIHEPDTGFERNFGLIFV